MIEQQLTMIPGPTPVHARILDALARPTTSHLAPELVGAFTSLLADVAWLCQMPAGQPFVVAGGGTLAMEMALVNLVAPRERVLVVSQGYFGDRFVELARAFGIDCELLTAEWGTAVPPGRLEERLAERDFAAVTITHVDTSTGTCAPVAEYCGLLAGRDPLVILDGVCATGGIDEPGEAWGVDVLLTAPQKAIGAPPGAALLTVSERALDRRRGMASVPAYSADLLRWLPVMQDPRRYFSTPCVNQIFALAAALELVREEGLERRFARHRVLAGAVRSGLGALGLELFTESRSLGDTLSVVRYPAGIEDGAFRQAMAARGVVVAGGLGPLAGRAFRLGHMGNIGTGEVAATLAAVEASLASLGWPVRPGSALEAASGGLAAAGSAGPGRA